MRSKLLVIALFLSLFPLMQDANAQIPTENPDRPFVRRAGRLANLTDEERAKLRAAHDKAIQEPEVRGAHERLKEARREFRDVMRPAMLRADPTIQPILDKIRDAKPSRN